MGNAIVRKYLGLERAASFIRDHHERWDGQGYTRGLKGTAISIQGRIMAICDSFDAIDLRSQEISSKKELRRDF